MNPLLSLKGVYRKDTKRCYELWWQGLPSKVRGLIWLLVIGNELNLTQDLYDICCSRAREKMTLFSKNEDSDNSPQNDKQATSDVFDDNVFLQPINRENTVKLIHLDVSRTFPNLGIFQVGGPYHNLLCNLLGAYVCYRPDIGYVQSMSFIAAVLLLQMDPYDAFVAFANLLNRPLQLAFFRLQQPEMTVYFIAYDQYFHQELPKLHSHFDQLDVRPDLYLIEWLYTLYAKSLPFDVTCRVWDIFLRDGEEFLFKTALGIIRLYECQLLEMNFEEVVYFLTHLPESMCVNDLFHNIEPFMRNYPSTSENIKFKRRFSQICADVTERINVGSNKLCSKLSSNMEDYVDGRSHSPELRRISNNVQNLKMSKSLSGFLGDLLGAPYSEDATDISSSSSSMIH